MRVKVSFVIFVAICCTYAEEQEESCGRKNSFSLRIFGGEQVRSNEWPWLVALIYWPTDKFFCAGSLISKNHVISGEICRVFG
jgi:secreted trypsin-like serine protease